MKQHPDVVYRYGRALYINLTNRCPNACVFCMKKSWNMRYRSYNLELGKAEPEAPAIIDELRRQTAQQAADEIVFCGYGEPFYRLDTMLEAAACAPKLPGAPKTRVNTIGLGNMIAGKDVTPQLKGLLDTICISLNTSSPKQWLEIVRPQPAFREKGFEGVCDFVRRCAKYVPQTVVTAVEYPSVDIAAVRRLASELGAGFRAREYMPDYQDK